MATSVADTEYFLELQMKTGWGRVLSRFRDWIDPQAGWRTLDVGCGPGLLPTLLAQESCISLGVDLDFGMLQPSAFHPLVAVADVLHLPFPDHQFDLVTASNLLFLIPDPQATLLEISRLLHPSGQIATLNPSENLTTDAATKLADRRGLSGLARKSLLNWASRAEANSRWTESETADLFASAGLKLIETHISMGPGFARFARGVMV